jgi:large subunit ribosomal protein L22
MAFGVKTNERPGTRCVVRHVRMSATKARVVLDLVRGKTVREAAEILAFTERGAAEVVAKALNSAVANAITNDGQVPEELYVSACFADEGPTLKRWRPRARGRATRIRKRTCHITIIVARLSDKELQDRQRRDGASGSQRRRGVIPGRRRKQEEAAPKAEKGKAAEAAPEEVEEATAPAPEVEPEEASGAEPQESAEEKAARYESLGREEAAAESGEADAAEEASEQQEEDK